MLVPNVAFLLQGWTVEHIETYGKCLPSRTNILTRNMGMCPFYRNAYISQEMVDRVADIFRHEIESFGYQF